MDLAALLQRLPNRSPRPLRKDAPAAVFNPTEPEAFVAPPLRYPGALPPTLPGILIVSAPGAVGKSTLAKYIASAHGAAYWDLSRIELGDSTFIGTIASAFGDEELSGVLRGLRDGSTLFVIDALDEAEIRSGWSRVASFLRQIAERTAGAELPSVVILARTDTAARAAEVLRHEGIGSLATALLEIDFFDEVAARRFVGAQLDRLNEPRRSDAHRRHAAPFAEALTAIFDAVGRAVDGVTTASWDNSSVRGILGYAPFLQAVAAFLSRYENYTGLREEITESLSADGADAVLASLLERLLLREQQKFTDQIRADWPAGLEQPDWDTVYSPRDQLFRCARAVAGDASAEDVPDFVPVPVQGRFADSLRAFVPQHPFLRGAGFAGPAFRDYCLAACLASPLDAIFAELQLESGDFVPTPLLTSFFARLAEGPGSGEYAAYLYDAAVSRFGLDHSTVAAYVSTDGDGVHAFQVVGADQSGNEVEALNVPLLVTESSPLTFRRRLRNADIVVDGPLRLRAVDGDFDLAGVDVQARRLIIDAPRLEIHAARGRGGDTVLRADTCDATPSTPTVHVQAGASLVVCWAGSERHPWSPYHRELVDTETPDRRGVMQALYRLLKWFRKDRRDELGKMADFIDNVVVGRHTGRQPLREALLEFLLEKNVLRRDGRFYLVGNDMVRRYGLNLPALRAAYPQRSLTVLVDEFLAHYQQHHQTSAARTE